jgi:hypothetical protein
VKSEHRKENKKIEQTNKKIKWFKKARCIFNLCI